MRGMDIRKLSDRYYVSPQISVEDIPNIAAAGVTCIICNRPDVEVPHSHCADAIQEAAEAAGLRFEVVPLTHQSMIPDIIARNRALGADTDDVVLAYCASGTRSCIAWALGQAGTLPADEIVEAARDGGYDLRNIQHALTQPFG